MAQLFKASRTWCIPLSKRDGTVQCPHPHTPCKRYCLIRGYMMPGIYGALKEIVCWYSLFPVIIRRQKYWFWSTIIPVESAEVARHPYRCRITWMYLFTWMALDMRGLMGVGSVELMAARTHDKGAGYEEHFDPLGGRNAQQRPVCSVSRCWAQNHVLLTLHSPRDPTNDRFWVSSVSRLERERRARLGC